MLCDHVFVKADVCMSLCETKFKLPRQSEALCCVYLANVTVLNENACNISLV